jgi:hypothetical protein
MGKMKAITLVLVVFFSTSFYSDAPRGEVSKKPMLEFKDEIQRLQGKGHEAQKEFQSINIKIDSLCKSYEKL